MGRIGKGTEEGQRREESLLSINCVTGPAEGRRWGSFSIYEVCITMERAGQVLRGYKVFLRATFTLKRIHKRVRE